MLPIFAMTCPGTWPLGRYVMDRGYIDFGRLTLHAFVGVLRRAATDPGQPGVGDGCIHPSNHTVDGVGMWDPLESTCRHASLSIL